MNQSYEIFSCPNERDSLELNLCQVYSKIRMTTRTSRTPKHSLCSFVTVKKASLFAHCSTRNLRDEFIGNLCAERSELKNDLRSDMARNLIKRKIQKINLGPTSQSRLQEQRMICMKSTRSVRVLADRQTGRQARGPSHINILIKNL